MKLRYYLMFFIVILSCKKKDSNEILISDFDSVIIDSLEPRKNKIFGYSLYNIWIEGEVNDSILIRVSPDINDGSNSFYFNGKIQKRLSFDYYGTNKEYFYFDPYKATNGRIKIKYSLN